MKREYLVDPGVAAETHYCDLVIVGSGIAGLRAALEVGRHTDVILITKGNIGMSNTWYAQGGIASAAREDDSPELHLEDTLRSGKDYCNQDNARILVEEGPKELRKLVSLGVNFDGGEETPLLAREGAHSKPRIWRVRGDATGKAIIHCLQKKIKELPGIQLMENTFVTDLLTLGGTCCGAMAYQVSRRKFIRVLAKATILASGGAAAVYHFNSNPRSATGDGVAMAYRAGVQICDMEFVQFHPTALYHPGKEGFLVSEAVRGEGALLRNLAGYRFMPEYDSRAELAPRDVVARSIYYQMQKDRTEYVFLDATHLGRSFLKERFPTIYHTCREAGIDISRQMIPVAPAAHYTIGGIATDAWGKTSMEGLYACGEAACTGVHGANRLASNSLLEGLVFGRRCAEAALGQVQKTTIIPRVPVDKEGTRPLFQPGLRAIRAAKSTVKRVMQDYLGIVREISGLQKAEERISNLQQWLLVSLAHPEGWELQNMITVASLIRQGAFLRRESRGAHYRSDYPAQWSKPVRLFFSIEEGKGVRYEAK